MAKLTVTLFGGFQARLDHGPPLVFPTKKCRALLAYLAVESGRDHTRERLHALLWGDRPERQARQSRRHALTAIRTSLASAGAALIVDGDRVLLDRKATKIYVDRFGRLLADGSPPALASAAGLYRGDLPEGLGVEEPPFEEWAHATARAPPGARARGPDQAPRARDASGVGGARPWGPRSASWPWTPFRRPCIAR